MSQGLGSDFDRAQRAYDARMPEEESPFRVCQRCKDYYNSDTQALEPPRGKDLCDECIQAIDDENGPQSP